jgi:hypothetical protein
VKVIPVIVLSIGVLMLASACTDAPQPQPYATPLPDGKTASFYAIPPATTHPAAVLIGIGIVCGTILLIVLALVIAHISTSWRHAEESDK